jgi:hypothetical protein
MPGVNAIAGLRERGKQVFLREASCRKAQAYTLAQTLKALLLRQKD